MLYKSASCRALWGKTEPFYIRSTKGPEALPCQITIHGTTLSKRLLLEKNDLFPTHFIANWKGKRVDASMTKNKEHLNPLLLAKSKLIIFKLKASSACNEVIIAHEYDSSNKMPEISAIIILFKLKRNHVDYYSINNYSLFSTPWVFLTIFFSFYIDYREGKKKKLIQKKKKKKHQKVCSEITCLLSTSWILLHHTTEMRRTNCAPKLFDQ